MASIKRTAAFSRPWSWISRADQWGLKHLPHQSEKTPEHWKMCMNPIFYRQVSLTELHVEEWLPCWHIPILDILVLICRQSKGHPIIAPCLPRKPLMSCVFEFPFVKIFEHFCKSRLICSRLVGCKDRNPLNPVICIKQMAAGRRTLPSALILAGGWTA